MISCQLSISVNNLSPVPVLYRYIGYIDLLLTTLRWFLFRCLFFICHFFYTISHDQIEVEKGLSGADVRFIGE